MVQKVEQPVYILAIETGTEVSSVAVFDRARLLSSLEFNLERQHARLLAPTISKLLEGMEITAADLSAVAVASGPGSYTGLRVGVSTAKGLAMSQDLPLYSMSSLEALAWQVQEVAQAMDAWIVPMIDARRMEVYTQVFDGEIRAQTAPEAKIIENDAFSELLAERKVIFIGNGAEKCAEILGGSANAVIFPQIKATARSMGAGLWDKFTRGESEDLIRFEPFYLKDFVATKEKNRLKT